MLRFQAKADAEAKFLQGQGIARQRQAIMEGLRESVNAFKSEVVGVDAKAVMDLMIVTLVLSAARRLGVKWVGVDRLGVKRLGLKRLGED